MGKVLAEEERMGNLVCKEQTEVSPVVKCFLFVCLFVYRIHVEVRMTRPITE